TSSILLMQEETRDDSDWSYAYTFSPLGDSFLIRSAGNVKDKTSSARTAQRTLTLIHIPQARSMDHQISSRTDPILKPSGNVCHRNKKHFWMAGPGRRIYDSFFQGITR